MGLKLQGRRAPGLNHECEAVEIRSGAYLWDESGSSTQTQVDRQGNGEQRSEGNDRSRLKMGEHCTILTRLVTPAEFQALVPRDSLRRGA